MLILNTHECPFHMYVFKISKVWLLAGVESTFCLWKYNNAAIPLWKSKTENQSGKQTVQRREKE